eukprot:s211_g13.t1
MSGAFSCLTDFTHAMDLMLDHKKTFAWSISPEGRASLSQQGFEVAKSCRSLGAHMQFTRQHTNATQMERLQSMPQLWAKLRLSACAYRLKVQALKVAAWPRALHAIAATTLSLQAFQTLRAGAVKGLQMDHAGCNAHLHLLCEGCAVDPQCWAILQTFRFVRECGHEEVIAATLASMAAGTSSVAPNGITGTLLVRIQTLAWHVDSDGCLQDDFGSFSLFAVSMDELQWRVSWAWRKVVAAEVFHRPGLVAFAQVDVYRTYKSLQTMKPDDRASFLKVLNGTHITQDGKVHCQEASSDLCPYCDSTDSRFHRFWQCEQFHECRNSVDSDLWKALPFLPESCTAYGWSLRPSTHEEWYSYLASIHVLDSLVTPVWADTLHVFTDGSCCNPHYDNARFASWAVVSADPAGVCHAEILDSGPLPGLKQTSVRAEIFAVLRAIKIAKRCRCRLMIWCDCACVVKRLRRLVQGTRVKPNSPNADLWQQIADDITVCLGVEITHVRAHQQLSNARSAFEEWCFLHNHFSDRAAARANVCRPLLFWELLRRHLHACVTVDRWNAQICLVILQVSRRVLRGHVDVEQTPQQDPVTPAEIPAAVPIPALIQLPQGAIRWYGEHVVRSILSWFWGVVYQSDAPQVWISHIQLFIDYTSASGEIGPVHFRGEGWADGSTRPLQGLRTVNFKQRVRWFTKVLKECLRHLAIDVPSLYCRPQSQMICMYSGCLALPWPVVRLEAIDDWLLSMSSQSFRRQTKAMESLPVPKRNEKFPLIALLGPSSDEAQQLFLHVVAGREKRLGKESPDTLRSVSNLACLLEYKGDIQTAKQMQYRAYNGLLKRLGEDHSETLTCMNNLATLLITLQLFEEAEPLCRRALRKREEMLGPEHRDTLTSVNNLAYLLKAKKMYADAEHYYRRALEGFERTLGPEHGDTLHTIFGLATLLEVMGRFADAEPLTRQALEGFRAKLGADHPDTLRSVLHFGAMLQAKKRFTEATEVCEEVHERFQQEFGLDHPDTVMAEEYLANIFEEDGRLDEAMKYRHHVLEARERVFGQLHSDTLNALDRLAHLQLANGDLESAEGNTRMALSRRREKLGFDHVETLRSKRTLAECLKLQESNRKLEEAHQLLQGTKSECQELLGGDNSETIKCMQSLADVLASMGELHKAEEEYQKVYKLLEKTAGKDHASTIERFAEPLRADPRDPPRGGSPAPGARASDGATTGSRGLRGDMDLKRWEPVSSWSNPGLEPLFLALASAIEISFLCGAAVFCKTHHQKICLSLDRCVDRLSAWLRPCGSDEDTKQLTDEMRRLQLQMAHTFLNVLAFIGNGLTLVYQSNIVRQRQRWMPTEFMLFMLPIFAYATLHLFCPNVVTRRTVNFCYGLGMSCGTLGWAKALPKAFWVRYADHFVSYHFVSYHRILALSPLGSPPLDSSMRFISLAYTAFFRLPSVTLATRTSLVIFCNVLSLALTLMRAFAEGFPRNLNAGAVPKPLLNT